MTSSLVKSEREKQWWEVDVNKVLSETDHLYTRIVELYPDKTKERVTRTKIIEARGWSSTENLFSKSIDRVLRISGFRYIPKQMVPGPAFIFPMRDVDGEIRTAQTKPLVGSRLLIENQKYRFIGTEQLGPRWLGNDYDSIQVILNTRKVVAVEGPFDYLAAKIICPELPILSPLTKRIGKMHVAYLRMLGVRDLYLMYDNEESMAGNLAMKRQANSIQGINVHALMCPKSDPSECLKDVVYARKLRDRLMSSFQ